MRALRFFLLSGARVQTRRAEISSALFRSPDAAAAPGPNSAVGVDVAYRDRESSRSGLVADHSSLRQYVRRRHGHTGLLFADSHRRANRFFGATHRCVVIADLYFRSAHDGL